MKNLIVGFMIGLFITACASSIILPTLSERELTIHKSGQLVYNYCVKYSFFGNCKEFKMEFYDLSKMSVREQLRDFRCSSRFRNL
jgi:hypothetical protein